MNRNVGQLTGGVMLAYGSVVWHLHRKLEGCNLPLSLPKREIKNGGVFIFARHTFKKRQQKNDNILQRHPPIWVPLRQNRKKLDNYVNLASYRVEQTMTPGHLFISILQLTVLTSQANGERRMRMEGRKRSHLCPCCPSYDMSAEAYRCVFQGWCPGRKHLAGGRRREVLL